MKIMWTCKEPGCLVKVRRGKCRKHNNADYYKAHSEAWKRGGGYHASLPGTSIHPGEGYSVAAYQTTWDQKDSYVTIHRRLKAMRGPASNYRCSCGKQAKDWSYMHNSKHEYTVRHYNGYIVPVSQDVAAYDPMCRSCHRLMDNEHARSHA